MPRIVDTIREWFLRNLIIPRVTNINQCGFVTATMPWGAFARFVFFPERILANTETRIVKRLGEAGRAALYSVGKRSGWRFYNLLKLATLPNPRWRQHIHYVFKFCETMYSSALVDEVRNAEGGEAELTIRARDLVVCRLNGLGHLFDEGGIAGLWGRALNNKGVEAVHEHCQGNGSQQCIIHAAAGERLLARFPKILFCHELADVKDAATYFKRNKPTPVNGPTLMGLINAYAFTYASGQLVIHGERFMPAEIAFIHLLEEALRKIDALTILEDETRKFYKEFAKKFGGVDQPLRLIVDIQRALGWGNITCIQRPGHILLHIDRFPWTEYYAKNYTTPILIGAFQGFVDTPEAQNLKMVRAQLFEDLKVTYKGYR